MSESNTILDEMNEIVDHLTKGAINDLKTSIFDSLLKEDACYNTFQCPIILSGLFTYGLLDKSECIGLIGRFKELQKNLK